nr:WD repeat-containing protein 41 isoform X5 [Globicephala melas]
MAYGPRRSAACGIFSDRGTNPCLLHRQADSQPLHHQGSPHFSFEELLFLVQLLHFPWRLLWCPQYAGLSLLWPLPLRSIGSGCAGSAAMVHGPSHSAACGIFPDRGTNPCPLHQQADSQPLRHQGNQQYTGASLLDSQTSTKQSPLQTISEEQTQNPYTELLVLKAHHDIVRFLVQLDDYRFASAGDDGIVVVWNAQTGEKLLELNGHTQKITAIITFPSLEACEEKNQLILTASADRTVIVWDCDTGRQVQKVSCFQSTVKCLALLQRLDVWLSGGNDLCVWNRKLDLLCKTSHLSDTGISALIEIPKNCVVAAVGKELSSLVVPRLLVWDHTLRMAAVNILIHFFPSQYCCSIQVLISFFACSVVIVP